MTAAPRRGVNPVVFGAGVWAGVIVSPRTMGSLASSVLLAPVRRALGRSTAASISRGRGAGELLLVVLGRGDGVEVAPLALRERFGGTEHDPLGAARGIGPGPQLTALEAIERLEPSLDIEEEQPHVLHWQTKKPSVAREEFGGHGVGSTTKGKGGKCFKCQQVGHWAAECPN